MSSSEFIEVDLAVNERATIERIRIPRSRSKSVFQWPEWKAFAARIGVSDRPLKKVVVTLECNAAALVEETFIGLDTCPQPPSDTCHMGSSVADQKPAPHPRSEDTTGTGHD